MTDSMLRPVNYDNGTHHAPQVAGRFIQSALDALAAHIAILDETGKIIGVNAAWRAFAEENYFQDPHYGIGTNYLGVCDASARLNAPEAAAIATGIRDVMNQRRREFVLEYPCHSPRERRWFVVRVSHFDWYGHNRLIIAHQNVSQLKRAQIELAESKQRLQSIVDNVVDGILVIDPKGCIISVNHAVGEIFAYPPHELITLPLNTLIPELDYALLFNNWKFNGHSNGSGSAAASPSRYEFTGQRRDGSTFALTFALSMMQLDGERVMLGIVQDITERKRLETEVLENQRLNIALAKERELRDLKNRFISMMSHELRTPLAGILLAADMLKIYGDRAPEEEKEQYIDSIQVQVHHLMALVRDVLSISRSELARQDFTPELVDLETYCRDIVEEMQLAVRKTHRINFEGTFSTVNTLLDRKLMRQAITNLLSNAIKYSPEGSQIKVTLHTEANYAVLRIRDKGIGIPEEDRNLLFEPFHRGANAGHIPGTGLGLAVTRQVIELQGGRIGVESQVNKGTTFTVLVPLHREDHLAMSAD